MRSFEIKQLDSAYDARILEQECGLDGNVDWLPAKMRPSDLARKAWNQEDGDFRDHWKEFANSKECPDLINNIMIKGLSDPIVILVREDREWILEGNHRLAAVLYLGWEWVDVYLGTPVAKKKELRPEEGLVTEMKVF